METISFDRRSEVEGALYDAVQGVVLLGMARCVKPKCLLEVLGLRDRCEDDLAAMTVALLEHADRLAIAFVFGPTAQGVTR